MRKWFRISVPLALTLEEWDTWNRELKQRDPAGFFCYHTFPEILCTLTNKLGDIEYWIAHRTYARYHIVKTKLKPDFYEPEVRILHACFSIFVSALAADAYSENKALPDRKKILQHLKWEQSLDDPSLPENERSPDQAATAVIKEKLYLWWEDVYPLYSGDNWDTEFQEETEMLLELMKIRGKLW